jgi:hypothetical protein
MDLNWKKLFYGACYGMRGGKLTNISSGPYFRDGDEQCSCRVHAINVGPGTGFYFSMTPPHIGDPKEGCENCDGYGMMPVPLGELRNDATLS